MVEVERERARERAGGGASVSWAMLTHPQHIRLSVSCENFSQSNLHRFSALFLLHDTIAATPSCPPCQGSLS